MITRTSALLTPGGGPKLTTMWRMGPFGAGRASMSLHQQHCRRSGYRRHRKYFVDSALFGHRGRWREVRTKRRQVVCVLHRRTQNLCSRRSAVVGQVPPADRKRSGLEKRRWPCVWHVGNRQRRGAGVQTLEHNRLRGFDCLKTAQRHEIVVVRGTRDDQAPLVA